MTTPHLILQTTVGTEQDAHQLANQAIEQHLAACVHIEPITSVYRWQGQIQNDTEWRLSFKTTSEQIQQLVQQLKAVHPYELPAFYTLAASPQTLEWDHWVKDQCNDNTP